MTARYDKYDGKVGGFRAPLNAAMTATSGPTATSDLGRIYVMALNGSGRAIKAASAAAAVGVFIANYAMAVGDPADIMTDGEIVDITSDDIQGGTAPVAGTAYFYDSTASKLTATAPAAGASGFYVGHTVEATRLVVRCQRGAVTGT